MYKRIIDTSLTQSNLTCDKNEGSTIRFPVPTYVTSGLVSYWKFSEGSGTTINENVNNYLGMFSDKAMPPYNPPNWTTGKIDSAIDFNGTDQLVEVGAFPYSPYEGLCNLTKISAEAWIYLNPTDGTQNYTVVGHGKDGSENYVLIVRYRGASDGDVRFFVRDNLFGNVHEATTSITPSTFGQNWHHIVGIANLFQMQLYVDNVLYQGDLGYCLMQTSSEVMYIGARDNNGITWMHYFDGIIDEVRVYNRALTDAEVEQNYNYSGGEWITYSNGLVKGEIIQEPTLSAEVSEIREYQETITGTSHVTEGLVSYWTFDEGTGNIANDSITTNDLTIYGSNYWYDEGHLNKCLDFDGSQDYATIPSNNSLKITPHITVECWINADTFSGLMQFCNKQKYILRFESDFCEFVPTVSGQQVQNTGISANYMTIGQWHHIVGTYNGTQIKFYLDGLPKDTTSKTGSLDTDNLTFVVGARFYYNDRKFDGRVDEVRLYNRALSDEEILQNYSAGDVIISTKYGAPLRATINQTNINVNITKK